MAALSVFYPELRLSFLTAPAPILDEALRQGAIKAATHSWLVTEIIDVEIEVDVRDYLLDASDQEHEVIGVKAAKVVGRELDPAQESLNMKEGEQTGDPKFYLLSNKTLYLYPIPIVAETLQVQIVVRPKRTASSLMDEFADDDDLRQATVNGAKRWLAAMAKQPWGDLNMVKFYDDEAMVYADQARIRAIKGDTNISMRVKQKAFGS